METAAWRTRHNPIANADSTPSISRFSVSIFFARVLSLSFFFLFSLFLSLRPSLLPPFFCCLYLGRRTFIPLFSFSLSSLPWLMINGADAPAQRWSRCAYWIQSPRRIIFVLQSSSALGFVHARNNEIGRRNNVKGDPFAKNMHFPNFLYFRFISVFSIRARIFSLTILWLNQFVRKSHTFPKNKIYVHLHRVWNTQCNLIVISFLSQPFASYWRFIVSLVINQRCVNIWF